MKRKMFFLIFAAFFFLFNILSCKKDIQEAKNPALSSGTSAQKGKANLSIETVSGPDKEPCGGFIWKVKFNLNNASVKGGWVVQKVIYDQLVINCPNLPFINIKKTYYEAWRVSPGALGDSERLSGKFNFDDQFSSKNFPDTKGKTSITGVVKFFENLVNQLYYQIINQNK